MSIALENLRRDLRTRLEADRQMSAGWILVPLFQILDVVILITVFFAILFGAIFTAAQSGTPINVAALTSSLIGLFIIAGLVGFILNFLFAYVLYRFVRRRNAHFARQSLLYEDLERAARDVSVKKGVDLSIQLNNLHRLGREAQLDETPRDPVLWSVILVFAAGFTNTFNTFYLTGGGASTFGAILIPTLAMYYVYYFLMKDMFRHERREDWFFGEFTRIFAALGTNITLPQRLSPIPDRSLIVYIILTIVTIGFFGVYWVYVLISDPNNHFRYQSMVEDTIIAQVSPVLV